MREGSLNQRDSGTCRQCGWTAPQGCAVEARFTSVVAMCVEVQCDPVCPCRAGVSSGRCASVVLCVRDGSRQSCQVAPTAFILFADTQRELRQEVLTS
jgi:hypothetical protein